MKMCLASDLHVSRYDYLFVPQVMLIDLCVSAR